MSSDTHSVRTAYTQPAHSIPTAYTQHTHSLHTAYTQCTHSIHTACTHSLHTAYTQHTHSLHTVYIQSTHQSHNDCGIFRFTPHDVGIKVNRNETVLQSWCILLYFYYFLCFSMDISYATICGKGIFFL